MKLYIPPSIEVTLRTNPIQQAAAGSQLSPRGRKIVEDQDDFLDIESPRKDLIDMLTSDRRDSIRCKTISVVGPGGSGKTVLVNAVYKSMAVMGKFHCHAWLSIPKSYKTEQLLQQLASRMCTDFPAGAEPATALSKFLVGKRYLVVFDYVDQDMRGILRMLPDYENGSRIIITTRYDDVAITCCTSDEYILRINGLDEKQSWKLFTKKAFGNGGCPDHLHDLAQGIVRRCDGLPQAISAVGSLLSWKGDQPAEWKRIHDNLGTHIQEDCISAMLPSYYDLPSDLKMCLLYFGILPEDRSIKRERLIRLWLSEGVIVKNQGKEQLETAAEESLNELISRNLVTATSRDFRGRVSSCCVQNMLRELILQRSKDEQFMEVITNSNIYPGPGVSTKTRRLSIDCAASSAAAFTRAKGFQLDKVRSLFMFGLDKSSSSRLPEILQKVRLLKILDLENAPLDDFPECLLEVAFLLRYLSLRNTKVSVVPKNIKKLRYLEHLDLKETQVTALPEEICSLQYLQQLLVSFGRLQGVEIEGELRVLHFLQNLSIIKVGHSRRFFEFLRQLPLLKKLGLVNVSKDNGKDLCACIEEMSYLSTLDLTSKSRDEYLDLNHMKRCPAFIQHLYLIGRLKALPAWIPSLSTLVRLILSWSKLSDSPVKLLQKLPNLLELKMIDAFTGEALSVCKGGFPKLRMLHIEQFGGLAKIEVSGEAMSKLQKLILVGCHRLYDLPIGIEKLTSLEELQLWDMPQEFTSKLGKVKHVPCIHSYTGNAAIGALSEIHIFS